MQVERLASRSLTPSSLLFRICIGGVAILFLAVVVFGRMYFKGIGIEDALSDYYYTPMRDVLVGGLCALATLLMCYRYQPKDHVVSFVAGACAILLAIFPTQCPPGCQKINLIIVLVHAVSSALFLLTTFLLVFYFFTLSDEDESLKSLTQKKGPLFQRIVSTISRPVTGQRILWKNNRRKFRRNWVYLGCGGVMIVALVFALLNQFFFSSIKWLELQHPLFWCETITLVLFAFAWIVKGGVILLDECVVGGFRKFVHAIISGEDPCSSTSAIGLSDASRLTPESPSDDQSKQGALPT